MVELDIEPTVPFGCHSGRDHCDVEVTVSSKENTDNCVASRVVIEGKNRCGFIITGKKYLDESWIRGGTWGGKRKLKLKHIIEQDTVYALDKSKFDMEIRITPSDHQFWSDTKISDIKVSMFKINILV